MRPHRKFLVLASLGLTAGLLLAWFGFAQAARPVSDPSLPQATGDLSLSKWTLATFSGGAPLGKPISYTIFYEWDGDAPAPGVQIIDRVPDGISITSAEPAWTGASGNMLTWDLGTLDSPAFGVILVEGLVNADTPAGTVLTNTATISGDVTDTDPSNNTGQAVVKAVAPMPDLWIWMAGLTESGEYSVINRAEQGTEITFEMVYFNWSNLPAPGAQLIDTLPDGLTYVSADPPPSRVEGQTIIWELGTLETFDYGEVYLRVSADSLGELTNSATITTTVGDRDLSDNTSTVPVEVVYVLPPRLLRPNTKNASSGTPLIVSPDTVFKGLARAGAAVTLYEGSPDGCWGDFSYCSPVSIGSAVAAADRTWSITPTLTATTTYLYMRAEKDGVFSTPELFGYYEPLAVRVDPAFEQAGWDLDNFSISAGPKETKPGGLGGQVGTTPQDTITITIRQELPDYVPGDPEKASYLDLRFKIEDSEGVFTETVPVTEFRPVSAALADSPQGANQPDLRREYDIITVHKGFGPGSKIEVWCRPVYYPETPDELPLVGLVWTLCQEILVDPAGYVYDANKAGTTYEWPEVPPDDVLILNATVTATVRTGDDLWERWEAERTGQVNPQVTNTSKADGIGVPGYYAFYVPSGQYQVQASAPGCSPYLSPILTVIDAPIFHNVGMRCSKDALIGVQYLYLPLTVKSSP